MTVTNLFLLPFAGGGKHSYNQLIDASPSWLRCIPIEIPGRVGRIKEELLTRLEDMVEDVFENIKSHLYHPYAIYGHSMGCILGYLLTVKILKEGLNPPLQLFLTASEAPRCKYREANIHNLKSKDFLKEIKSFGGTPQAIIEDLQLFSFFEPILKADFKALETYIHKLKNPIEIPILIGIGSEDKIGVKQAEAWSEVTTKPIELMVFSENHFFIFPHVSTLLKHIGKRISELIAVTLVSNK